MTCPPEFEPGEFWYLKLDAYGSKFPPEPWGGYSQDFETTDTVFSHQEIVDADHAYWGVCGCQDPNHMTLSTLIFDLDIYKAEDFDPGRISVPEDTLIVRSQNGGLHVYFKVHADRGSLTEGDFTTTADLGWDVDVRGSSVSAHVVAPTKIPGNNSPYEVVNNEAIKTVTDAADAADKIRLDGAPLLEYDPDTTIESGVEIDRSADPPAEMPTCYYRGLQLRAAAPEDHPNTHKVNLLTALCGLAAGYDVDTMVTHFCEDYPPGEDADRKHTRYQLEHLVNGGYSPPAISTLRRYGILNEEEGCKCSIAYHASGESAERIAARAGFDAHTTEQEHG